MKLKLPIWFSSEMVFIFECMLGKGWSYDFNIGFNSTVFEKEKDTL